MVIWTKELGVGIKKIDDQHKFWFATCNEAIEIAKEKETQGHRLGDIVLKLMDYARFHFAAEEGYFKKYGYPYAEEHLREHAKLLKNAEGLYGRFKAGEDVAEEFASFMMNWLESHIKKHDMKYAKYFKEIGVSDY